MPPPDSEPTNDPDGGICNDDDVINQGGGCEAIGQRYPSTCLPGVADCAVPRNLAAVRRLEETQPFHGLGFAGSWSHGKMVLLDNAMNNIDYGLSRGYTDQRMLTIYQDQTGADWPVRIGTGKYPGGEAPPNSTGNTSFIDSTENLFNWNANARPLILRDVVWHLNTGRGTTEVAFDDYLDNNALIIAEMSGALSNNNGENPALEYHDGWKLDGAGRVNTSVASPVYFQNAATSPGWVLPAYGVAEGNVRLEPVALGGVEGKGAWLDGDGDAIMFNIPSQSPKVMNQYAFYLGVFIDPRFNDDNTRRQLFSFGNGSGIILKGLRTIEYENASGTIVQTLDILNLNLTKGAWAHLAFVLDYPGNAVHHYVNGYLRQSTNGVPFNLLGALGVGDKPNTARAGFRGWIDELKLLAYRPSYEVACNHAFGTLMNVTTQASSTWTTLANKYSGVEHAALANALGDPVIGSKYVCYQNVADRRRVNRRLSQIPTGLKSVRDPLLFPEEPLLVYNAPRPKTITNSFCLSCHDNATIPTSLSTDALSMGTVVLQHDPRRQPMMSPRIVYGNVPTNFFGTNKPPANFTDVYTDEYLYP